MKNNRVISGFSKMDRERKLDLLLQHVPDKIHARREINSYLHGDSEVQRLHNEFSENTISNFHLPYGIAPNFLINGRWHMMPMVTEESSVVAAAAKGAKFWAVRGGFKSTVSGMIKNGQLHFIWKSDYEKLKKSFPAIREMLLKGTAHLTGNMVKRGGGIRNIELLDLRKHAEGYYIINAEFDTCDSMGANFINSCMEEFGVLLKEFIRTDNRFENDRESISIIMAILSNYAENCLVSAEAGCHIDELKETSGELLPGDFARKFTLAFNIAQINIHRAVTHNKGIFNGIDAVVIATGNDFRAVEAAGHAWAARTGQYRGLSEAWIKNGRFHIRLTLPMAVGTVGGLTALHPLARRSLEILGNPGAEELMGIIASAGLASNFAAVSSLVTKGIQSGHMKMHLSNILNQLNAEEGEREAAIRFFAGRIAGYAVVGDFLNKMRNRKS
jgi:hydroxymethylglutaryl-CoA reductase